MPADERTKRLMHLLYPIVTKYFANREDPEKEAAWSGIGTTKRIMHYGFTEAAIAYLEEHPDVDYGVFSDWIEAHGVGPYYDLEGFRKWLKDKQSKETGKTPK